MALVDLVGELVGTLPGLDPILAQNYINRALSDIYDSRTWSFLVTDGLVVCPAQINSGSAAFTQYLSTVTLDATASAAIAAQLTGSAVPGILQLQIRFAPTPPSSSQVYSILDFDNSVPAAVVLTVDRPIVEATSAASSYTIYRCYVTPPITDFLRWEAFTDMANAITLSGQRLTATSTYFDRMDPQRTATGLSYWLGAYLGNRTLANGTTSPNSTVAASTPIYELWPHPTTGQTWYVRFRRKGTALTEPTDAQPSLISDTMILSRALSRYAYPFAAANVANFPGFKNANWVSLIIDAKRNYNDDLVEAKRLDNEQQLQDVWNRGHGLRTAVPFGRYDVPGYPIDANFLQSHLIRF